MYRSTLLLFLAASTSSAQIVNRINGAPSDSNRVEDAAPLANGDVLLGGDMVNFQDGIQSVATLTRTGPDGSPIWCTAFDSNEGYDTGVGVRALAGGDAAFLFYAGTGNNAVTIARTDANGNVLWAKRYPGDYSYPPGGMKVESGENGDSIIFANRYSSPEAFGGQLLRVGAAGGAVELSKYYFGDENVFQVYFSDVVVPAGEDYFVTGGVYHFVPQTEQYKTDLLVARIDRAGNVVWSMAYDLAGTEFDVFEEGRSIALTQQGNVAVLGRTTPQGLREGYDACLQLLIDPATGALLASNLVDNVDPAPASLEQTSSGNLLASGTRRYGDGQGAAQMWLIDPSTMQALWRAEYDDGQSGAADAIEPLSPLPRSEANYIVVGAHYTAPETAIGTPDQMFIRTDSSGNDFCSANLWIPGPIATQIAASPFAITPATVEASKDFDGIWFAYTLDSRQLCTQNTCPCDLNHDGFVDDADFSFFVVAYDLLLCDDPLMPPGCPADFNADGFVDDADFSIFVVAYNDLLCP
ncbi:MAG: hypothetical protein U0573_02845 [Phycisphaerales bacterium]|nr:hypothetical protein [Planctomycetota bacterium]